MAKHGQPRRAEGEFNCSQCRATFGTDGELQQHMTRLPSCAICAKHLLPGQSLQEHYRTSLYHPHCMRCDTGFVNHAASHAHQSHCIGSGGKGDDTKRPRRKRRTGKRKESLIKRLAELCVLPDAIRHQSADNACLSSSLRSASHTDTYPIPAVGESRVEEQNPPEDTSTASSCTAEADVLRDAVKEQATVSQAALLETRLLEETKPDSECLKADMSPEVEDQDIESTTIHLSVLDEDHGSSPTHLEDNCDVYSDRDSQLSYATAATSLPPSEAALASTMSLSETPDSECMVFAPMTPHEEAQLPSVPERFIYLSDHQVQALAGGIQTMSEDADRYVRSRGSDRRLSDLDDGIRGSDIHWRHVRRVAAQGRSRGQTDFWHLRGCHT
ncbi:hypothetical protein C8T65DRAFT_216090 [Cerioporus squamosus]|nr:hypothetical protein C8T65DRAFT_216090 [Cerioporus squamosus]